MILKHKKTGLALGFGLVLSLSGCANLPFLGNQTAGNQTVDNQTAGNPSPSAVASASPAVSAQLAAPSPTATPTKSPSPTKPKGKPPLTLQKVKNAEYFILADGPVKLVNGKFQDKKKRVFTLGDVAAYGDLNRDGIKDAIASLTVTIDGRNFTYLVGVLNEAGNPKHTSADFLGESVTVKTLSANAGKITVKMDKYGPNDPAGFPSQTITRTYTYTPFKQKSP